HREADALHFESADHAGLTRLAPRRIRQEQSGGTANGRTQTVQTLTQLSLRSAPFDLPRCPDPEQRNPGDDQRCPEPETATTHGFPSSRNPAPLPGAGLSSCGPYGLRRCRTRSMPVTSVT